MHLRLPRRNPFEPLGPKCLFTPVIVPANCRLLDSLVNSGQRGRTVSRYQRLLKFRVLGFRLLQDGNVGVGVFPEGEEVLVGSERPYAGGVGICSL